MGLKHAALPLWEQATYWVCEGAAIIYMMYSLYCASEDAWRRNEPIKLENGWMFLNRPRDFADSEWDFWSHYIWQVIPWMAGHLILSRVLRMDLKFHRFKKVLLTLYSILVIGQLLGFRTLLFFCAQSLILYLASAVSSVACVWTAGIILLTVLNYGEHAVCRYLYLGEASQNLEKYYYVLVYVWANLIQRWLAFCLERVWAQRNIRETPVLQAYPSSVTHKKTPVENFTLPNGRVTVLKEVPTLLDMFYYAFYIPLFFTGPLIVYKDFHMQEKLSQPCSRERLRDILLNIVRIMFWTFVNCTILHFFYAHALIENSVVLGKENRWVLTAVGYFVGQFFMMKYIVIFGLPAQLARIDGFEPPTVPACVSYIYCYTDMWKYFDKGLYDFMKRYIFIPCGGSQHGFGYQLLGSVLCFLYVFYWHGAEYYLFLWCLINLFEVIFEQLGASLESTHFVRDKFYTKLSPAGIRRVRAVSSVPLLFMSLFAIFYFFGGSSSGPIFLSKLLLDIPWDCFLLFLVLVYCAVQNAMEIDRLGLGKLRRVVHRS